MSNFDHSLDLFQDVSISDFIKNYDSVYGKAIDLIADSKISTPSNTNEQVFNDDRHKTSTSILATTTSTLETAAEQLPFEFVRVALCSVVKGNVYEHEPFKATGVPNMFNVSVFSKLFEKIRNLKYNYRNYYLVINGEIVYDDYILTFFRTLSRLPLESLSKNALVTNQDLAICVGDTEFNSLFNNFYGIGCNIAYFQVSLLDEKREEDKYNLIPFSETIPIKDCTYQKITYKDKTGTERIITIKQSIVDPYFDNSIEYSLRLDLASNKSHFYKDFDIVDIKDNTGFFDVKLYQLRPFNVDLNSSMHLSNDTELSLDNEDKEDYKLFNMKQIASNDYNFSFLSRDSVTVQHQPGFYFTSIKFLTNCIMLKIPAADGHLFLKIKESSSNSFLKLMHESYHYDGRYPNFDKTFLVQTNFNFEEWQEYESIGKCYNTFKVNFIDVFCGINKFKNNSIGYLEDQEKFNLVSTSIYTSHLKEDLKLPFNVSFLNWRKHCYNEALKNSRAISFTFFRPISSNSNTYYNYDVYISENRRFLSSSQILIGAEVSKKLISEEDRKYLKERPESLYFVSQISRAPKGSKKKQMQLQVENFICHTTVSQSRKEENYFKQLYNASGRGNDLIKLTQLLSEEYQDFRRYGDYSAPPYNQLTVKQVFGINKKMLIPFNIDDKKFFNYMELSIKKTLEDSDYFSQYRVEILNKIDHLAPPNIRNFDWSGTKDKSSIIYFDQSQHICLDEESNRYVNSSKSKEYVQRLIKYLLNVRRKDYYVYTYREGFQTGGVLDKTKTYVFKISDDKYDRKTYQNFGVFIQSKIVHITKERKVDEDYSSKNKRKGEHQENKSLWNRKNNSQPSKGKGKGKHVPRKERGRNGRPCKKPRSNNNNQ